MEAVVKAGNFTNPFLKTAYQKACEAAEEFKEFSAEHPFVVAVFVTVIAFGVLVFVAPYALELLGFGADGPIAGRSLLHR